jgi:hypothetical protein
MYCTAKSTRSRRIDLEQVLDSRRIALEAASRHLNESSNDRDLLASIVRAGESQICPFDCGRNPVYSPKTAQMYTDAMIDPEGEVSTTLMAIESRILANGGELSYGAERRLWDFPGVQLPMSAACEE